MDQLTERSPQPAEEPVRALGALLSPDLDPLFLRPERLGVDSAWYGHVPFAHWIVRAARPRTLVELGAHAGVSYFAFCEAVRRTRLDTRCYAVDTWKGDEHAGFYGEEIFEDVRAFHDAHYAAFSRLLRCTFDEALAYVPDGSVDLLHIDGRHRYEDARHDFESWSPKLSACAVVLFHDTNVRERDFGVWRLWAELREQHPAFEFLHAYGLGVLAWGEAAPPLVAALCRLENSEALARMRERFAILGERWAAEFSLRSLRQALSEAQRGEKEARGWIEEAKRFSQDAARVMEGMQAELAQLRPRLQAAEAGHRSAQVALVQARLDRNEAQDQARVAMAREAAASERAARAEAMRLQLAEAREAAVRVHWAEARARDAEAEAGQLRAEREILLNSTAWRITAPLRAAGQVIPNPVRRALRGAPAPVLTPEPQPTGPLLPPPAEPPAVPEPAAESLPAPAKAPGATATRRRRIVFVSGEPETPGNWYRCVRYAEAAQAAGWDAVWLPLIPIGPPDLAGADVVVLWRTAWDEHIRRIIDIVHDNGAIVVFDVDDLMVRPDLARIEVIDGIRTMRLREAEIRGFFYRMQRSMFEADFCTCTTPELARHIRRFVKPAYVLPNGFDEATHCASRLALRQRRQAGEDGLVRLGYATGSRTHQRDFAVMVPALVRVLHDRPQARLVLYRAPSSGEGVVLLDEFPELEDCAAQVEWRDLVGVPEMPKEMARFDVNLAPLEVDNPFCEAKSELKYFEAALVDVPTVASPTGPYRRAITDGRTGFLPRDAAAWQNVLLRLIDDPALRRRVGTAAYHDALWRFGPHRQADTLGHFLHQLMGGEAGAQAFELEVRRAVMPQAVPPDLAETETLLEVDQLREAEVTVVVPVYNYAQYLLEALDSVRAQTLEPLDLVVIDDRSSDGSAELALEWARAHQQRFNRVLVLRHTTNSGLGAARNSGFAHAETPFVLPLDADNRLRPACCETLLGALRGTRAAFAYPRIQQFGDSDEVLGAEPYAPSRFIAGNYIDAMALIAKWAWAAAGGYDRPEIMGWEDFDFWCSLTERGLWGVPVPEVLTEYRVHAASMIKTVTEARRSKARLVEHVEHRHPWLDIVARD